jgi:hypothetical protein
MWVRNVICLKIGNREQDRDRGSGIGELGAPSGDKGQVGPPLGIRGNGDWGRGFHALVVGKKPVEFY